VELKKYHVCLTRPITESVVVTVDAPTPQEAEAAAWDKLDSEEYVDIEWLLDDGSWNDHDTYVSWVDEK